jgi:hypothetical protein
LAEYPESWAILQGNSNKLIVRLNTGYTEAIGHSDYPIKMGVAMPFNGEHDENIQAIKDSIEDAINHILENGENGSVVAIITSLGEQKFLEFLSYTRNNLDFKAIHEDLKKKFSSEDIQMYAEPDRSWNQYKSFLK